MQAEIQTRKLTKGEYRVGVDFNPAGNPAVKSIKEKAAALIDELEAIAQGTTNGEVKRTIALAQTEIESAAMWGVKAITKGPMPE